MKAFTANAAIAHAATIPSKGTVAVALPKGLELIAAQIAGAMQETVSLSETLGSLTRDAGLIVAKNPDMLEPFVDACRQMCGAVGLTDGSFKVYLSNIRGVVRAMCNGYKPKDGQSLRAMYDAAPKGLGANKGNTGPRTDAKATKTPATASATVSATSDQDDEENAVAVPTIASVAQTKADKRRAAMIELFGHADDELDAALAWAASNELSFTRYVKANLQVAKEPSLRKAA